MNEKEILNMLRDGVSADAIAEELTNTLNKAKATYEEETAKAATIDTETENLYNAYIAYLEAKDLPHFKLSLDEFKQILSLLEKSSLFFNSFPFNCF